MDLAKTLAELREQRDDIDQAILSLERLASGRPRGRGRPPGRSPTSTARPKKRRLGPVPRGGDQVKTASE
jgi:hypothetical protein